MHDYTVKPDLLIALEDKGNRLTEQRRRVAALLAKKDGIFSLNKICTELPTVGRATVYRTIKLLLSAGVVCKTNLPSGAPRYSTDHAYHHHHIICIKCGRMDEFRHASVERMLRLMAREVEGVLIGHRMELYITCRACL